MTLSHCEEKIIPVPAKGVNSVPIIIWSATVFFHTACNYLEILTGSVVPRFLQPVEKGTLVIPRMQNAVLTEGSNIIDPIRSWNEFFEGPAWLLREYLETYSCPLGLLCGKTCRIKNLIQGTVVPLKHREQVFWTKEGVLHIQLVNWVCDCSSALQKSRATGSTSLDPWRPA